jgi:hypothetical protein
MKSNILLTILVASTLSITTVLAAPVDDRFSLSTRFDYNSNKYEAGPWVLKFTAPASISGTGIAAPEIGHIRTDNTVGSMPSDLSNTEAAATINVYPGSASTPGIDLTGKVKVNLADKNKFLGLSQNDYAAQMDVYQNVDKFTAKGSLGSRVLGNNLTGIILNPVLYGSFGGAYQLSGQASTGVDMSLSQDPSLTGITQHELTAYVSYKLDKNLKARGYLLKGFSNGNPNTALGGQVYYGF